MKLITLNIEKQNHLERVKAFLDREKADVVALMEVCEEDLDGLLGVYPYRVFGANFLLLDGTRVGGCLASKQELTEKEVFYADENESERIPSETQGVGVHRPVVVMGRVGEVGLAATHFTWTPNMSETDKQAQDLERLLAKLGDSEVVLCGDFNIPRGNGAYAKLAKKYKDTIPSDIVTTIDFDLHRAKREGVPRFEAVVDYLWTSSAYVASDVRVECGVSDHCGVVGMISSR